ncbi:MAG: DUF4430 domain-containing protein [Clostridiaceae bacterium]|nr:DUF4430 domain-containing protein [Clostridiaceae bacterium]
MKKMEPIMKKIAVIALILLLFFTGACAREEAVLKPDDAITIAVTVDCVSILNNSNVSQKGRDLLDLLIEKDLSDQKGLMFRGDVNIAPAQSAFHALQNTGLEVRYRESAFGPFVHSISGLGDKDAGPLSGWVYLVNGEAPDVSSGLFKLEDGDMLHWRFTVEETDLFLDLP